MRGAFFVQTGFDYEVFFAAAAGCEFAVAMNWPKFCSATRNQRISSSRNRRHGSNTFLNAAFFAASADTPVEMAHLLEAAKLESLKIERPFSDVELRGWVA